MSRVLVRYQHQGGSIRQDSYNAPALYSILRGGELPIDMEIVISVTFPYPTNSTWLAPTADRQEQIKMLAGLLKPYFDAV